METQDNKSSEKNNIEHVNRSGRTLGGLVIIAIGTIFLLNKMDFGIPHWITSWPMILIAVGAYVGARHSFRNPGWLIPVFIGTVFLMDRELGISFHEFIWPIIIICIGLFMIFKPKRKRNRDRWQENVYTGEDYMDSVTIFGNIKKNIITKEFKGGEATAIFGGTELNFSQADIDGKVVLDLTMMFGGVKLIVPPHWKIQTDDMVAIFGGVEDKRPTHREVQETNKTLILKGTCVFGGIDIKSY
jgi:predicted membrane protein